LSNKQTTLAELVVVPFFVMMTVVKRDGGAAAARPRVEQQTKQHLELVVVPSSVRC
jgi:hypothetical protein